MTPPHLELQVGQRASVPSGLGGRFNVTLREELPNELWKVRVNYPTPDFDGYEFTIEASKIRLEG